MTKVVQTKVWANGKTLTMLNMYDPKQYKIPNRWNTSPYNTADPFQMAKPEPKIVKTPDSKGAGAKFLHRRHPASKPSKFGPLSRAAE
jgi:hypothetical protein